MSIPTPSFDFNIGTELERLNGSIPWRKPVSASSERARKEYVREAVEREFAGQMREALEWVLANESAIGSANVLARVRAVLDDIRAQTGEDFHDPL